MRFWRLLLALPLLAGAALACVDVTNQKQIVGPTTPNIGVADVSGFTPNSLTVSAGATVTWSWFGNNTYAHNVVFTSDTALDSGPPQKVGLFTVTLPHAGTFNYHCTVHGEQGVIIVQ